MNKFQPIKFSSIEDFLDYLTPYELEIVLMLRDLIKTSIPNVKEKLSYNVPFYSLHKRICFIWPASVPWGKVEKNGVILGFSNGNLLPDPEGFLEKGTRKQVYTKTFFNVKEIDPGIVKYFIFEAIAIDEQHKLLKKS